MSKKCPNCQEVFDDSHAFCSNCGSRLIDNEDVNPALNLGDANAISGGVSINQSKNITSHDTHYHTTTVERVKSESELKLDASNQLRTKAEEIMAERGRIDSVAMNQLRPLSKQLGIDEETFKSIIKDVRSSRNGAISGLSAANARYLQQAQQAVKTKDMDALSNLTPRLEAMAAISQDDNVQFMYYLTLSILYRIKRMEVYERQMDENYWRTFWAIISYIRTGKHAEATKVLALFDPLRYEKSEEDQNLLEAYFNIMKEDKDGAQEFLDEILGEPTEQVKPLLRAVESTLYEEEPESLEVRFYMERVMSKSDVVVKSQKKTETPAAKEEPKTAPKPEKKAEPKPNAAEGGLQEAIDTLNENPQYKDDFQFEEKQLTEEEARALYDAVDKKTDPNKLTNLQQVAETGDVWGMFFYARLYALSDSVKRNYELAVEYYTKAANAGCAYAMNNLGICYEQGEGINQDYAQAVKWYRKAADAGNAVAMNNLGYCYEQGEGINQDYAQAVKWYRKAADAGNAVAMNNLGICYEQGEGINQDYAQAVKWYRKAADAGCADAMYNLGHCYCDGIGVKRNYSTAVKWYKNAIELGVAEGMSGLAWCYEYGNGVKQDYSEALNWYQKSIDNGREKDEWITERINECKSKVKKTLKK